MSAPAAAEPVLRTLAPTLRRLDQRLRTWMTTPRRNLVSAGTLGALETLSADLMRQATSLDTERPVLVVMLMGGTGVGKSSLLNALARGPVAHASYARPTTRDPVVYYHESIRPDRLDRALQQCRLVAHDRPNLEHKIIVDTPDLDSNEAVNRETLRKLLPVADVVLYVGSQEKYHDQLGWELFLEQRQRLAFAFVLNKWDRCLHGVGTSGLRPDEDLLRDLRNEGFERPLLFRTCAQAWVEANGQPPELPEGEQFAELEHWLELGLTRLEIDAIKARGVGQLLASLESALEAAKPPDVADAAARTQKAWERGLKEEAQAMSDILLVTVDPYQREIEQHFSLEGHRRFRGLMAGFLQMATRLRYLGTTLRKQLPRPLRGDLADASAATAWNLAAFSEACSTIASDRHLDARGRALPDHLLVLADQEGFPVSLLGDPTEAASRLDWRKRFTGILIDVLKEVESEWARPSGPRRGLQTALIWLGDLVPLAALLASCGFILYDYFWSDTQRLTSLWEAVLFPVVIVFVTLLILYIIIILVLPIRWPAIRGTFHRRITERLHDELNRAYLPIPKELADVLAAERRQVDELLEECRDVTDWLRQREQAAHVGALYGSA